MRADHRAVVALALVVVVAALVPAFVGGRPANEIPVHEPSQDVQLVEPASEDWLDSPSVTVPLSSAPSTVPKADKTSVQQLSVRAAVDDGRLYVRVSWPDATADTSTDSPRAFADAVAVQLPVNTTERPAIAMGGSRSKVNVWYWSGSTGTEELLAGGAGSTTAYEDPAVTANASHDDGRWTVVFARDLEGATVNRTTVPDERNLDVAFAVWNGSSGERSGRKAVSEWHHFATGPGPQGPPYAAVLWTIAGLAVAVVVVVTGHAVQRHRTEESGGGDGG
jgi:DMSO reductase family type II enzyme heme b subunit